MEMGIGIVIGMGRGIVIGIRMGIVMGMGNGMGMGTGIGIDEVLEGQIDKISVEYKITSITSKFHVRPKCL